MAEWDACYAALEEARRVSRQETALSGESRPSEAEAVALAEVQAVRERIGAFIREAARQRSPIDDSLVVANFVSPDKPTSKAAGFLRRLFSRGN